MAKLPDSGISISIVAQTLGVGSNDLGTLCAHPNVNKWSRFKPVRYPGIPDTPDWWKSYYDNCGLDIPGFSTLNLLFEYYKTTQDIWAYERPRGGAGEPYRLGDFRGYKHDAQKTFKVADLSDKYYRTNHSISIGFAAFHSADEITLDDIATGGIELRKGYFAAALFSPNSVVGKYKTAANTVEYGAGVQLPITGMPLGEYSLLCFITNKIKTSWDSSAPVEGGTLFFPLPDCYKVIQILNSDTAVWISAKKTSEGVDWQLRIENNNPLPRTFVQPKITVRYGNNSETSLLEAGERYTTLSDITVSGNSVEERSGTFRGALPNFLRRSGYVLFQNTSYPMLNAKEFILEDMDFTL